MESGDFDPRRMVVLEPRDEAKLVDSKESGLPDTSWSLIEYDHDKIRLKASTNKPAYLILSEMAYPGWQAKVDGKKVKVLCGNYLFRVIPLDKGEHEVLLYFVSWPFRIGICVSLLTLIGCICFILRWKKRN
jgi:uncharacterized membrane protein YfhO